MAAVVLQFDLAAGVDRNAAVPVVLHDGVVNDENAVEPDGDAFTDHFDAEAVPLSDRIIRDNESLARILLVVVEAAGTNLPLVGIPDLDLRCAAEIEAGVAAGGDLPVAVQWKILDTWHVSPLFLIVSSVSSVYQVVHSSQ